MHAWRRNKALADVERRSLLFIGSLIPACALLGATALCTAAWGAEAGLPDHVARVIEWRGSAESWVRKIKTKKLSASAVSGAQDRYDEARTAFEAWRMSLKTDLAQRTAESSAFQRERLRVAAEKAATFIGYAEGVLSRGGPAAASPSLVSSISFDLAGLAGRLLELFVKDKSEQRQEVAKILDQLEWRPFEAI